MPKYINPSYQVEGYDNFLRKFSRLENSIAAEWNFVWEDGNGYEGLLTTEEDIEVSSSSVNDTYGTGTHGQYAIIWGQGNDGIQKAYTIKLNGTNWVRLSAEDLGVKYMIIYRARCISKVLTPLNGANDGKITIRSVDTQKKMAIIKANNGQTQMGLFKVPADKVGEFTYYSVNPDSVRPFLLDFKIQPGPGLSWVTSGTLDFGTAAGPVSVTYPKPLYFAPGSIVMVFIKPEQAATTATVQFFMNLIDIENYEKLKEEGKL